MGMRLGLDVGTNSIGWALFQTRAPDDLTIKSKVPYQLMDAGVRIISTSDKGAGREPKGGAALNERRRIKRGMRRNQDRAKLRKADLMQALVDASLMPLDKTERKALEALDPYQLRTEALDRQLPPHHIGRALFHLHQRRGFKSNRKSDTDESEAGKIKQATIALDEAMKAACARTWGEFLWQKQQHREGTRSRLLPVTVKDKNGKEKQDTAYPFYATRQHVEDEFNAIWQAQKEFHAELTEEKYSALHKIFFRQRKLRPPIIGKCALDPAQTPNDADGFRAPWALPEAQSFRIWQEVNNLTLQSVQAGARLLSDEDRKLIALALHEKSKLTFNQIRKLLKVDDPSFTFNLESDRRKDLLGDQTAHILAHKDRFGAAWRGLSAERQTEIVDKLLTEENEALLLAWLEDECGLTKEAADKTAKANLPDSHCRLGRRALGKLIPHLKTGMIYSDAAAAAGYHHSDKRTGEVWDRLPYYGEVMPDAVSGTMDPDDKDKNPESYWGRLPNPTVHIGLNQIRKLVNAIIDEHGPIDEIIVELARDLKLSKKQKDEINKQQTKNQKQNELRAEKLRELGFPANGRNLMLLRLWEELDGDDAAGRACPFTGEKISIAMLFSGEAEIEHLLPYAATLDDSPANKTICLARANRYKGRRSPFDAFGQSRDGYDWQSITERAARMPFNKRWRFGEDAMQRFADENEFANRQLTDTAYLARLTRTYLGGICDPSRVWVVPGRMTAMLRAKWGLNSLLSDHNRQAAAAREAAEKGELHEKQRNDHRHHMIDAIVAGMTDRSLINRMARANAKSHDLDKVMVPDPWDGFRDEVKQKVDTVIVSHKPDHGVGGQLLEETAYGLRQSVDAEKGKVLVIRKQLAQLTDKDTTLIRDPWLRTRVTEHLFEAAQSGTARDVALAELSATLGIKRVRLELNDDPTILAAIKDKSGNPYKYYAKGENLFVDIAEVDGKWKGFGASRFDWNRKEFQETWHQKRPGKFVMRIYKGDLIELEYDGVRQVMRVYNLDVSANRFKLANSREAGSLQKRHDDIADPFRWLMASYSTLRNAKARKVVVNEAGKPAYLSDPVEP